MEPDRFKQNKVVFIVAMVCLLISLTLVTLSLYLLPYLFFNWTYAIPGFVPNLMEWLNVDYAIKGLSASFIVFMLLFVPGVIAGFISKVASNSIENHIYGTEKTQQDHEHLKKEVKATFGFGFKLIIIIALSLLALLLFEWLIQSPNPYS